jgi:hypothetical protein
MKATILRKRVHLFAAATLLTVVSVTILAAAFATNAQGDSAYFFPGNLVVSRSVYVDTNNITPGTTILPPNCSLANCPTPVTAVVGSAYPFVWNNDTVDASFGITSKIVLDQITPAGALVTSLEVPNSSQNGVPPTKDQMVTSFSSKSEIALNLSTDGSALTFMGYLAPIGAIDVSNSNTPGVVDSTDPVGESAYRVVAQVDQHGKFHFTNTNAYSGNNGRAAILNNTMGANLLYTAGNAGNGSNPQPAGIIIGAGAQILTPEVKAQVAQATGTPAPVASFNITQLGLPHDKIGKDTNFRGLTIFDNVLYYTKGSGSNGINTVYFVDTTGSVCYDAITGMRPANGVGLPLTGAALPTSGLAYNPDPTVLQATGLPDNMCILKGLPTILANTKKGVGVSYPFGIWFANATTLYVADEGNGATGKTAAGFYTPATAAQNPTAGLQKWVFDTVAGKWNLAYTLTNGLGLGAPYSVPNSSTGSVYPTGNNDGTGGTGFPWAPATDGLRNITGVVNGDGTATIYAITSTISGSGDQGADPNQLVKITDSLSAAGPTPPIGESVTILKTAPYGEVLRGVSWAPGTGVAGH